jgi:hypothetical protein
MSRRSLSIAVAMLRREGLPVGVSVDRRRPALRVRVQVGDPHSADRFRTLTFDGRDLPMAADWAVDRAIRLYPKSCIAALWRVVRDATVRHPSSEIHAGPKLQARRAGEPWSGE